MRLLVLTIFLAAYQLFASDHQQIKEFVLSSIEESNAEYFGFKSKEEVKLLQLGKVIKVREIDNKLLQSYPATGFSVESGMGYLPILINGEVRCFVVIDKEGKAVSFGYRQLAEDLTLLAKLFSIPVERIELYTSRQINSYLISIPEDAVAAAYGGAGGAGKNLIVLNAEWKNRVGPAPGAGGSILPSERETIGWIKKMGGNK